LGIRLSGSRVEDPAFDRAVIERGGVRTTIVAVAEKSTAVRVTLDVVIDSLLVAQHVLEMFRRALPNDTSRRHLDRLSNRLAKIVIEARKFATL
jgi:hypothetical protein